ncbi:HipA protein [Klebsiella pneumoniae subsp. rhinoscleromatis]|nr:HipA protein [Klebsiella pneumoniae subsp. rhinoscleromatis]
MATLTTWMNNVRVGTLTRQANGAHSFRYDEEWLRSPRARPLSLSLPLQYGNITADAVYHYFDNLLPDSRRSATGSSGAIRRARSSRSICWPKSDGIA